ncbi:MAG TPA: hypothetical protein DDZ51_28470 [Planctomycetaceae bacterium]|nr:hypothetical protein [Planctomycetaceae bacterium]
MISPLFRIGFGWLICTLVVSPENVPAQEPSLEANRSVLQSISGFDKQRVEAVSAWWRRPDDPQSISEAAKLLFQVNRLGRSSLASQPSRPISTASDPLTWEIGDAVAISGRAQTIASIQIDDDLADVLDFSQLYRIEIETDEGTTLRVIATSIPESWISLWSQTQTLDQPMSAIGMVVSAGGDTEPRMIATPKVAWFPAAGPSVDETGIRSHWALLAQYGFDVSMIEQLRSLNRKPLVAADQNAFYSMLRAASEVQSTDQPTPETIDAADLLRNPGESIGKRIRLRCQTVRITRVTLNNPTIIAALGSDHYWQIDALGELGNVVIRIEPQDKTVEPAVFENRYPISLATIRLPDFLAKAIGDDPSQGLRNDVLMLSQQLTVDGFFYRLWSYENELMQRHGGGNQFGPLVMASQIIDSEPLRTDVVGVAKIGQWAAIAAVAIMLAAGAWIYSTSRQDARARAKRELEANDTAWLEDSTSDEDRR